MNQKAIFFDIDGTIYEAGKPDISDTVKKAIHAVQSLGHLCFIASGRPYTALPDMITSLGFDGYICGNGTQIAFHDALHKEICINPEKARIIIDLLKEMRLEYIILTTNRSCVSQHHDRLYDYLKHFNVDLNAIRTEYNLHEVLKSVLKIETLTTSDFQTIHRIQTLAESLGFFVEVKKDGYIELSDKTITKGTAMLEILNHFNIPVQDSICLGDGLNDLDMFHTAGYCIAMGNAVDEIRAIADEVTLTVSEDGAAHALHRLFGNSEH